MNEGQPVEGHRIVAIARLTVDPTIQIRERLSTDALLRYEHSFEFLPPIVAYDTGDDLLVADGHHRLAVAERLGRTEIEVEVRIGTRETAIEHAILANASNGKPLTVAERDEGVRRLQRLHPDWSARRIARAIGLSHPTVSRILDAERLAGQRGSREPAAIQTISAAMRLPKDQRSTFLEAARRRRWSPAVAKAAVREITAADVPQEQKRALLGGTADPLPDRKGKARVAETSTQTASATLSDVLGSLDTLAAFPPAEIIRGLSPLILKLVVEDLPGRIDFLRDLLALARETHRQPSQTNSTIPESSDEVDAQDPVERLDAFFDEPTA